MVNPAELAIQVRFALSQLPDRNAHHAFEEICYHLTKQFICSNVLPATRPVGAGGDQGRDFETFRTYLREELGPHGWFLGRVSEGTLAFVCTIQATDLRSKLSRDIARVCGSGHTVQEIGAFTLAPVPVAARHALETESRDRYDVDLQFHDANSIAALLAEYEGFWIAEQFLVLPAEIRPDPPPNDQDLPQEYLDRRHRWREKRVPIPTLGDFVDLKMGLRHATFHAQARNDLPFWLDLFRALLSIAGLSSHIKQCARYELVVATFRGTGEFKTVEDIARAYFEEALMETEPARLEDASALLMYTNTAVRAGLTSITPADLTDWNDRLASRAQELLPAERPHRRASLLFALGHLGLHPALQEDDIEEPTAESRAKARRIQNGENHALVDIALPADLVLVDNDRTLSAWTELVKNLDTTPLFPIQRMADLLQLLLPLWSTEAEWRRLLDLVDQEVEGRSGRSAVAARARDRAMKLLKADRRLDALEEFHQVKVDWWAGETVRGSLLAMLMISRIYLDLRLPLAAKAHALAASYVAWSRGDDDLADLIPQGLLTAANCDFISGAWCNAVEMFDLGLQSLRVFAKEDVDFDQRDEVQDALLKLTYITGCAREVDGSLADAIRETNARFDLHEVIDIVLEEAERPFKDSWASFARDELTGPPFSDLGASICIRFSALGTDWRIECANNRDSTRAAERFAAGAQVMLAALAREDICLVPVKIAVRVELNKDSTGDSSEVIEALPSNDGRQWVARLQPAGVPGHSDQSEMELELLTMLTMILREASLLPEDDFSAVMKRAHKRGLGHKLFPARPFDELLAAFSTELDDQVDRTSETPWNSDEGRYGAHEELEWQNGPGPTYSKEKADELLHTRYDNLAKSLRITSVMLRYSPQFQPTIKVLREKRWLDWHLLTAVHNFVMNYRFPEDRFDRLSEETQRKMKSMAFGLESATASPLPVARLTLPTLDENRKLSMLALLNHWDLECHQMTPDFSAIERLLAARYGYWNDDVPHEDPFPGAWQESDPTTD